MTNILRKIALQITIPALCGLIVLNTYLVAKNLKAIERNTAQRVEAAAMQADISNVLHDLQDMETGQRGYLLTGDAAYLKPYEDANRGVAAHLANLRSRLAGKAQRDRALETQLESATESKIAEMSETIRLRERGYRHRAFQIVNTNRGKELMDQARAALDQLSSAQTGNVARYDLAMRESVGQAVKQSILASLLLLVVTVVAFLGFNVYRKRLEIGYARHAEQLQATSLKLEQFSSTIFHDFRSQVEQMRDYANSLLDVYGGFLPRQGQEKTEHIENGAGQMIRLLDDLSRNSRPGQSPAIEEIHPVETLSA